MERQALTNRVTWAQQRLNTARLQRNQAIYQDWYVEDLDEREIAAAYDMSLTQIKRILQDGRRVGAAHPNWGRVQAPKPQEGV